MAIKTLEYEKLWTEPNDFATKETSETKVREDLQYHPNAVRTYINDILIPSLIGAEGSANIGHGEGSTLAAKIQQMDLRADELRRDLENVTLGDTPESIRAVEVKFEIGDWVWADWLGTYVLSIAPGVHKRTGSRFGCTINMWDGYRYRSGLWATACTGAFYVEENQYIGLASDCTYKGSVVFYGV